MTTYTPYKRAWQLRHSQCIENTHEMKIDEIEVLRCARITYVRVLQEPLLKIRFFASNLEPACPQFRTEIDDCHAIHSGRSVALHLVHRRMNSKVQLLSQLHQFKFHSCLHTLSVRSYLWPLQVRVLLHTLLAAISIKFVRVGPPRKRGKSRASSRRR